MKKLLNKKGFTLIELIVVIAIIAILAAILIPALLDYIERAEAAKDQSNCRSLYTAAQLAYAVDEAWTVPADTGFTSVVPTLATGSTTTISEFVCTTAAGATYSLSDNFAIAP
jgi:prepilin-type N-terminal cleavage/methylation domain-containing protein